LDPTLCYCLTPVDIAHEGKAASRQLLFTKLTTIFINPLRLIGPTLFYCLTPVDIAHIANLPMCLVNPSSCDAPYFIILLSLMPDN
jgi:hypothetical protein